jgi:PiT family inorganic phosphate transporter
MVLTAVGLLVGVLLEGSKMVKSLDGTLVVAPSETGLAITLGVAVLVTLAMTLLNLPTSISASMVGAILGVAVGSSLKVNLGHAYLIVAFWFVSPLLSYVVALVLHKSISRYVSGLSLLGADSFNRVGVVLTSLAVAYSLGANNIGMIYGTALGGSSSEANTLLIAILLTLVAVAGGVLLGKRNVSGTLGDKMLVLSSEGVLAAFGSSALLVWIGTQLQVPMSISHCILGGMLGAAFSYKIALVNKRLTLESISTWVVVPVASFLIAIAFLLL